MTVDGRVVAGRYRLGRRIGSGAMGVVWQAHDELLDRTVAVKQLLLQPGQTEADAEEARRRAMREGRIAARLQHPNAVAVFDVVDEGDGKPWLVMEYVPSRSLSAVLDEHGTLPPQEAARIGCTWPPRWRRARRRHRAPRRQARQRPARRRRHRQDHRLRHLPRHRRRHRDRAPACSPAPPPTWRPRSPGATTPAPPSDVFSLGATRVRRGRGRAAVRPEREPARAAAPGRRRRGQPAAAGRPAAPRC